MTREERKAIYVSLCEKGKITSLFMQPWWLESTGDWDVSLALRNGQVVGAMPFAKGKRWGISTIGMPALTQYVGIWMDKPPDITAHKWLTREKQIIWLLIDDLPAYGFFSMVFETNSFNNWLPFHWKGFRQEMRYTFTIDQMNGDTLDQQINRNLKRNLKDATLDLELRKDVDLKSFFDLCSETFKRQKIKMPYNFELLSGMDEAIRSKGAGVRLGAYNRQQRPVAVAYLLWDSSRAYYLLAGDNEDGRQSGASIFLCREALRIAFEERKVSTFDYCGSMLESITEIRRQFGARGIPLMKIFKAKHKWLDILYVLTR